MLLIGPPGSGKTSRILGSLEAAIRAGRSDEMLLLVPTASMKHHLLNVLARRGLMVPARAVSTMAEFVRDRTPEAREAQGAIEGRLLRDVIRRTSSRAFGIRSDSTGLRRRVASLMSEFWAAGADSFQIEPGARRRGQRAFVEVFREYEDSLSELGLVHHNQRIARAAARIRGEGLGPVRHVLVDGFDRFTRQQEELLGALAEQSEQIVVAMPARLPRYPLETLRPTHLPPPLASGLDTEVVQAPTPRAEILEVARRILSSGRPLREHAIILRSPEHYRSAIREVFETLRIPYRNWERTSLADHGLVRHFSGWLRVIEQQLPGEETVSALMSPLTPERYRQGLDEFEFAVRKHLPGAGLDFFRDAARGFPGPSSLFEGLGRAAGWPGRRFGADRWCRELLELQRHLQELQVPFEPGPFRRTCDWREALDAQKALRRAIEDSSDLPEFEGRRVGFGTFSEALDEVLRAALVPVRDQRYEVVHVLPVLEARQWSVPVAFVCGLADGWFPRRYSQDVLFDDEDRKQLQARGIAVRTTLDRATEERFLFEVATTRATRKLVLSYPLADLRGKPLLRSDMLDGFPEPNGSPWSRLGDTVVPHLPSRTERLPAALQEAVAECNERFSVSGIQDFRQCPYLYFSGKTLRLEGRPPLPEHRLDNAVLGTVVHRVLERWNARKANIGEILDQEFAKALARLHLPVSFRTERLRLSLRSDLLRFAREQGASLRVMDGHEAFFEESKSYRIPGIESRPEVRCRIDRFDLDEGRRCVVTDYKYARPERIKAMLREHLEGDQLQLMIYLSALEQDIRCEPSGMALCGLRGQTSYEGVAVDGAGGLQPLAREELHSLLEKARAEAAGAVASILDGAISVLPRDEGYCGRICEFGSVCRVKWHGLGSSARRGEESAS